MFRRITNRNHELYTTSPPVAHLSLDDGAVQNGQKSMHSTANLIQSPCKILEEDNRHSTELNPNQNIRLRNRNKERYILKGDMIYKSLQKKSVLIFRGKSLDTACLTMMCRKVKVSGTELFVLEQRISRDDLRSLLFDKADPILKMTLIFMSDRARNGLRQIIGM